MGYTTEFKGTFHLDRRLDHRHYMYLREFSDTRRVMRNPAITETLEDPIREAAELPVGIDGEYFVGAAGDFGFIRTPDVIDYNRHPKTQPGLWCNWEPTRDGQGIKWNGAEKFYNYTEWLVYIIQHFLIRWKYTLNGEVMYQGEDINDRGVIKVVDNDVKVV